MSAGWFVTGSRVAGRRLWGVVSGWWNSGERLRRTGLLWLATELSAGILALGVTVALGVPIVVILSMGAKAPLWCVLLAGSVSVPTAAGLSYRAMGVPAELLRGAIGLVPPKVRVADGAARRWPRPARRGARIPLEAVRSRSGMLAGRRGAARARASAGFESAGISGSMRRRS